MKSIIIFACAVLLFSGCSKSPSETAQPEAPDLREAWLSSNLLRLATFQPTPSTPQCEVRTNAHGKTIYGIRTEGLITFDYGGWAYISTHSTHADDGIGDVLLARDNLTNFWSYDTHVCGGVWIEPKRKTIGHLYEFLDSRPQLKNTNEWNLIQGNGLPGIPNKTLDDTSL